MSDATNSGEFRQGVRGPKAGGRRAVHLEESRRLILDAALKHAAFDGWTWASMKEAAAEAGIDQAHLRLCFPKGPIDLIDYYWAIASETMSDRLAGHSLDNMGVTARIRLAVLTLIDVMEPDREAVRRALALEALPQNTPLGLRALYRMVDTIWRDVGDTSTDFNFYTKRAVLGAVVAAVTACWLTDQSEGYRDTHAFLDRRLEDVMRFEKAKASAAGRFGELPDIGRILGNLRYRR